MMKEIMKDPRVYQVIGDMWCFSMSQDDELGEALIRKPTGFMTNAEMIATRLARRCDGGHRHIHLVNGRAKKAEVYPEDLCKEIIRGLRDQMEIDGRLNNTSVGCVFALEQGEKELMFYDDVTGEPLDFEGVLKARAEEIAEYRKHNVYSKVPIAECIAKTGKKPIGMRWIDINKGDRTNPDYRSRLVAKEIKRDNRTDLFAATPPLEAKKCYFRWRLQMAMDTIGISRKE